MLLPALWGVLSWLLGISRTGSGNGAGVACIEAPKPARCNAGTSGNVEHQSGSMLHATAWLVACCTLRHYTKPEMLPEGQQPLCHSQTQGHGIPKHGGWQAVIIARQGVYDNGIASKPGSTASLCRNTSGAHRSSSWTMGSQDKTAASFQPAWQTRCLSHHEGRPSAISFFPCMHLRMWQPATDQAAPRSSTLFHVP